MLFEPGPLTLIVAEQFPLPGEPSNLAGFAAAQLEALRGADATLAGAASLLGDASSSSLEGGPALDLGTAAAELDAQGRASDPAIGGVAGSAASLEGRIAALAGEVGNDLYTPIPRNPRIPPDGTDRPPSPDDQAQPRPGTVLYDQGVIALYESLLGRTPGPEELASHRGNPRGLPGVRDAILQSDEYLARTGGSATPTSTGGRLPHTDVGIDAFLDAHPEYRPGFDEWLSRNPGDKLRAPAALGWPGF